MFPVDHQIIDLAASRGIHVINQLLCDCLHALIPHIEFIGNHERLYPALVQIVYIFLGTAHAIQRAPVKSPAQLIPGKKIHHHLRLVIAECNQNVHRFVLL